MINIKFSINYSDDLLSINKLLGIKNVHPYFRSIVPYDEFYIFQYKYEIYASY